MDFIGGILLRRRYAPLVLATYFFRGNSMLRFQAVVALVWCCAATVSAAEPAKLDDAIQQLAVESEAVVVARVSSQAALPRESGGSFALWIVRSVKGRLRGGRDIIWVGQKELAGGEVSPQLWMLFLQRGSQGDWHIKSGANNAGLVKLTDLRAPVLAGSFPFPWTCPQEKTNLVSFSAGAVRRGCRADVRARHGPASLRRRPAGM